MHFHITHSPSAGGALKMLIHTHNIQNTSILIFADDFLAIGPICSVFDKNFIQTRNLWILENLFQDIHHTHDHPLQAYILDSYNEIHSTLQNLSPQDTLWLYADENANGILFLSYILHFVPDFADLRVKIIKKNNRKRSLGEYNTSDIFEKFFQKGRKFTENQKQFYKSYIAKIPENNILRIYKNRQIRFLDENFYDSIILKNITKTPQTLHKIYGSILHQTSKIREISTDVFIFWRIKELIKKEKIVLHSQQENYLGKQKEILYAYKK